MDTVSMLNTMSFYCQPILPLVYDESMSYYETLCKVVGQLNNTGETVNKLNEGLTAEIADRQAGDAALDERLKKVEETDKRIHFLVFDGANPNVGMPTRGELYQWVHKGDAIFTLFRTNEEGRGQIYAASCSYNAGNWGSEASNDFNIIVPIETKYDSANDYAIKQKVAKLTIPPISQSSLSVPWGLQIIEINTPSTSAEGVVNLTASLSGSNEVNCSITPSEFLGLYNMTRGGKNLCVAVNARLEYDAHIRSSSIATVNPYARTILITFEQDEGVYTDYGVNQTIRVLHYLIGNAETNTWEHESIRSRIQDFVRYEGFQFTRKSGNVIATENDSTPSAVYSYYTQLNGKLYQNLPTRLIDEVDGAEYWNGIFDSYSDGHITFTFTTANYATIGDKMTVRVIELSATKADSMWSGAEKWSYAAKEFDIPYRPTSYVFDVWQASDTPTVVNGYVSYDGGSNLDFDDLLPLVENNQRFVATLHKGISETAPEWSSLVYSSQSVKNGVGNITFAITTGINLENGIPVMDGTVVFSKDASGAKKVQIVFASALPAPTADGSDDGKVPAINGTKWELKDPTSKPLYITIDVTNIDERIYTLTDGNKTYTVEEIYEAKENGTPVFIAPADIGAYFQVLDFSFSNTAFKAFFLNVVRRTDMSYGRLILSTIGGQTKGTYNVEGFLATASSANNGKFLKMKQDGSGIEYVVAEGADFVINATLKEHGTAALDKTFEQIHEAVAAGKTTIVRVGGLGAEESYLQLSSYTSDYVTFLNTGLFHTADAAVVVRLTVRTNSANYVIRYLPAGAEYGSIPQVSMSSEPNDPMEIATKKYVDEHKSDGAVLYTEQALTDPQKRQARVNIDALGSLAPNIKQYMIITPATESDGIGVSLSATTIGNGFKLDISDANEDQPTLLIGVKTPTDADTNAAATVEYVIGKAKKKVWIDVEAEEVKTFNYTDIDNEITNGGSNVWLELGTEQLRMVACNKSGASSYDLTFVNLDGASFNIHTVTVSASAAEYSVTSK